MWVDCAVDFERQAVSDVWAAKPESSSGSTDWSNASYLAPAVETGYPILDRVCTWHSEEVVAAADSPLGYDNTITVAKAMALAGLDIMLDQELRGTVQDEFVRAVRAASEAGASLSPQLMKGS